MVSVIIPARNEIYLERTIRNVLSQSRGEIEILAMLDGYLPDPRIVIGDERVVFYHFKEPIGQRQCVNAGAKYAKGKYIMKLDAHCAMDEGFDVKLTADCEKDWTVVPRMYNLNAETWEPKRARRTDYMYISSPKEEKPFRMSYFSGRRYREEHRKEALIDDTMCIVGCCWFLHKDRFWELGGMDEDHGGWGQMGIEVACKAWLSGGRLVVNKKTWFSHYFRGGGGPGFPYKLSGRAVENARKYSRDLWLNNKWEKQTRKFQWMLDKFNPPTWSVMKSITELKGRYKGQTCHIVVKGPSLRFFSPADLDQGPVIAINEATHQIESYSRAIRRGWKNPIYSMQKDRNFMTPRKSTLLVSERQSKDAFPLVPNERKYVFDTKLWFGDRDEFSANCALKIAKLWGCTKIKLLCFDALTHGDYNTLVYDKLLPHDKGKYDREAVRFRELLAQENFDRVEWITPRDLREHLRILDIHKVMEREHYPKWRGVKMRKLPNDIMLYHQVLWELRPDFIVECGTCNGGSALFFADMFDLIGKGHVISIDIDPLGTPVHPRITYIRGSSIDRKIVKRVDKIVTGKGSCMVILDSKHTRPHVKWELVRYAHMVTPGQYLVVEDCHTRGRDAWYGPGEATNWFLRHHRLQFKRTRYENQFFSTVTRHGWLLRI